METVKAKVGDMIYGFDHHSEDDECDDWWMVEKRNPNSAMAVNQRTKLRRRFMDDDLVFSDGDPDEGDAWEFQPDRTRLVHIASMVAKGGVSALCSPVPTAIPSRESWTGDAAEATCERCRRVMREGRVG